MLKVFAFSYFSLKIYLHFFLENIDLALIAANDNYPPEVVVVEEDIDKSVSQEGQAKL